MAGTKQPDLLSIPDVARLLGVSRQRVQQLITPDAQGRPPRLESVSYGHVHLIPRAAVLEYKRGRRPGRPKKKPLTK
jgi:hypothetical protein